MASGGDDESTSWTLNLDVTDALSSLGSLQDGLSGLGDSESVATLAQKFTKFGIVLGTVGAAAFALKESMDAVFEGEDIEATNQQFETLADNFGIAGDKLKEGLQAASGGLVDDETLLKAANKGIVELGANAQQLDQVMTVARQASAVTGGDVAANFSLMTQAIASGQTRQLRGMGIVIDQQKAYDTYAKSIGVATNELSKEGQQHAVLNAVLEQSKTAFAGIDPNVKEATNAFQAFKATIIDIKDALLLAFEKIAGPTLANFFNNLRGWAGEAKTYLQANLGEGVEASAAKTKILESQLMSLKLKLTDLHVFDKQGFLDKWFGPSKQEQITKLKQQIEATEAEINGLHAQSESKGESIEKKATQNNDINLEQRRKDVEKFNKDLNAIREKNLQDEMKNAQTETQVNKLNDQLELAEKKKTSDAIKKIQADRTLDKEQKQKMVEQTQMQSDLKIKKMDQDLENAQLAAWDNYAQNAKSKIDGISRAFAAGTAKNKHNLQDFNKLGAATFDSFSKNAVSSFEAIGAGSESAGDAMKGLLFGVLADMAEQQGTFVLLSSVWPPNPVGLAEGAALLALAGFLRSQAGGSGGAGAGVSVPSSVGSSMNTTQTGFGTGETPVAPTSPGSLNTQPQSTVNLTIQGNYMDTNESRMAMMDMIRQATDATDFNYFKVGGT